MNDSIAISARSTSKCYRVFENQRARFLNTLWPKYRSKIQEVWALQDVSFEIRRGEAVALIGRNGSGKSTLLEILAGTLTPTNGEVQVNGRVSALLELGSGFNPEYTGRDNVFLNGLLLGLTREEILRRFDEIIAFADIGEVLDRPVKTYSSGMMMRLAFAVQVLCEPDILIIDEALSVGDFFFQQKCLGYIRSLCEKGVTLLFVSHDMGTVRDLCSRAVYLRAGKLQFDGASSEAIRQFMSEQHTFQGPAQNNSSFDEEVADKSDTVARVFGDAIWRSDDSIREGRIIAVAAYDSQGAPCTTLTMGEQVRLVIVYKSLPGSECHVSIEIRNKFNQTCTVTGSYHLNARPPSFIPEDGYIIFDIAIDMVFEAGNYALLINLGRVHAPNRGEILHELPPLGPIVLTWDYENDAAPFLGQFGPRAKCSFAVSSRLPAFEA